jgi:hypothetical protein
VEHSGVSWALSCCTLSCSCFTIFARGWSSIITAYSGCSCHDNGNYRRHVVVPLGVLNTAKCHTGCGSCVCWHVLLLLPVYTWSWWVELKHLGAAFGMHAQLMLRSVRCDRAGKPAWQVCLLLAAYMCNIGDSPLLRRCGTAVAVQVTFVKECANMYSARHKEDKRSRESHLEALSRLSRDKPLRWLPPSTFHHNCHQPVTPAYCRAALVVLSGFLQKLPSVTPVHGRPSRVVRTSFGFSRSLVHWCMDPKSSGSRTSTA